MAKKKNAPPEPTEGEIDRRLRVHRRETRERETQTHGPLLEQVINTAGLPKIWASVARVAVRPVAGAASNIVAGLHPESPGGRKLTRAELEALAEEAGRDLAAGLIREFADLVA